MAVGGLVLGSPILYLKGIRILMFQLSGFYYRVLDTKMLEVCVQITKARILGPLLSRRM